MIIELKLKPYIYLYIYICVLFVDAAGRDARMLFSHAGKDKHQRARFSRDKLYVLTSIPVLAMQITC